MARLALAAAALVVFAAPARAQEDSVATPTGSIFGSVWRALSDSSRAGWLRPTASLIIPGSGQLLAGNDRAAIYLVLEAALLTRFVSFQREGSREGDRFRELALTVARAPFSPSIRDTVFEYFEQMEKFAESGPLDTDPGPGFAPPTDYRTFNGSIWALARQTFFTNPDSIPDTASDEYKRALEFYLQRAVGPNFRWSWRDAGLERDLFAQSIRQSDEAFRRATQQLGFMLANHLLSAVDAFVSHRLSRNSRPVEVTSLMGTAGPGERLHAFVMVSVAF